MHRLNNFAGKLLGLFLKIITTLNYYLNTIVTDSISAAIFFPPKFNKSVMTYEVQLNHFRTFSRKTSNEICCGNKYIYICTSVYTQKHIHLFIHIQKYISTHTTVCTQLNPQMAMVLPSYRRARCFTASIACR